MSTARKIEDFERALSPAAALLRDGLSGEVPRLVNEQSKQAVLRSLTLKRKVRPRILPWMAAAASFALFALTGSLSLREETLAHNSFGAHRTEDGFFVLDPAVERGGVRFSDGTVVVVQRDARLQVVNVDARGARLTVGQGHARFHVVHKPKARWSVAAGPYDIEVTGTRFDVSWAATQHRFELALADGSVTVRGPQVPHGVRLTAGQKVIASSDPPMFRITKEGESVSADPVPEAVLEDSEARERPKHARSPTARESWTELVRGGEFESVLVEARERGIVGVLNHAPLADLVALADAARYSHEVKLSQRALEAQRRRFARSSHARDAAFLLGRLSEDKDAQSVPALRWYERYLREAPTGTFASEALGRRMVVLHRTGGLTVAAPIARDYLRRFPNGPYAARARELTQAE